jgi:hypothetical protein
MFTSYLRTNGIRGAIALGAVLGTFFAPWWVPFLCMVLLSLRYPAWEVPLIGLLIDLLWLPGGSGFAVPLFTIAGVSMTWIFAPLRNQFLTP